MHNPRHMDILDMQYLSMSFWRKTKKTKNKTKNNLVGSQRFCVQINCRPTFLKNSSKEYKCLGESILKPVTLKKSQSRCLYQHISGFFADCGLLVWTHEWPARRAEICAWRAENTGHPKKFWHAPRSCSHSCCWSSDSGFYIGTRVWRTRRSSGNIINIQSILAFAQIEWSCLIITRPECGPCL